MVTSKRIVQSSYAFLAFVLILVGVLHLGTPLITILFSVFALRHIQLFGKKWVAITGFLILVAAIFYGFVFFFREALSQLPKIADSSIPIMIKYANQYGLDLPFSDLETLNGLVVDAIKNELAEVGKFAEIATKEFVFLIIGLVIAVSIFLKSQLDLSEGNYVIKNNVYTVFCRHLSRRFATFFRSFEIVMGAQLIISIINTIFTGVFIMIIGLPNPKIVLGLTFLCGILPIVGNLISNTVIVGIALITSPNSLTPAIETLVFLVALHKMEYFLNSKIIGGRIHNPMWLTLLGLIFGESLMGIPGMILAPVVFSYVKLECSQVEVSD